MIKYRINLKEYKEVIISLITILQLIIMVFYIGRKTNIEYEDDISVSIPIMMEFNEIIDSLSEIKNIDILEIEDLGYRWYIKVLINGENEKIVKTIDKMENFEINNYNINGNNGILSVILELNR